VPPPDTHSDSCLTLWHPAGAGDNDGGLSTGALVGIVIGSVAGAVLLLLLISLLYLRYGPTRRLRRSSVGGVLHLAWEQCSSPVGT
jgi:hypothetical protein